MKNTVMFVGPVNSLLMTIFSIDFCVTLHLRLKLLICTARLLIYEVNGNLRSS